MTTSRPNPPVFAVILFLLGSIGFGIGVWGLSNAWSTRDWVEITADVINVEQETYTYIHHRNGGNFDEEGERLRISFGFSVDGEPYTSDRYSRLEAWDEYTQGTTEEMNEQLARLQTGLITAYYNPEDPSDAVLLLPEKAPPGLLLCAGLIMLGLSVRSAIKWRRARRAHRASQ